MSTENVLSPTYVPSLRVGTVNVPVLPSTSRVAVPLLKLKLVFAEVPWATSQYTVAKGGVDTPDDPTAIIEFSKTTVKKDGPKSSKNDCEFGIRRHSTQRTLGSSGYYIARFIA